MARRLFPTDGLRRGFTLVELLVVIAIIGILVSLLLPAVQAAREAGRRTQCSNHLKQLALACQQHVSTFERLPSNGWGWRWLGVPERGTNHSQPGGWIYNLLPYLEQQALHDLQLNKTGSARDQAGSDLQQTPLEAFNCPSRRAAIAYPWTSGGSPSCSTSITPPKAMRSDYAANAGTDFYDGASGFSAGQPYNGPDDLAKGDASNFWDAYAKNCVGVLFAGSEVRPASISDGLSNTYLCGEKYLNPDSYENGADGGDNESMYIGDNADISRWVGSDPVTSPYPPLQDRAGHADVGPFGSAHSGGLNMAFCDGSVHSISYSIDPQVHWRLGNRKDGLPVDSSRF